MNANVERAARFIEGARFEGKYAVARRLDATPEQRERILEKLPPRQQEALRRELERFDSLPEDQKRMRIEQAERFEKLTPDQRSAFREQLAVDAFVVDLLDAEALHHVLELVERVEAAESGQGRYVTCNVGHDFLHLLTS